MNTIIVKAKIYKILWGDYQKNPALLEKALDIFKDQLKGKTAVKIHFGEPGNDNAMRGPIVKTATDWVVKNKINGFLVDTNTLYTGHRSESSNHLRTAREHGFGDLGLPIVIDDIEYPQFTLGDIDHRYNKLPIHIGKEMKEADSMLCLTHFKGHGMLGFGGALKNLGMGGAVPVGKRVLHAAIVGEINKEKCLVCGICINNCPANAISIESNNIVIDKDKCIGCGECVTVCPNKAVEVDKKDAAACQEKTAVYACGLAKGKPTVYVNYLINIGPLCDCAGTTKPKIIEDLGILISTDPVAIDQASIDWVNKKSGKDLFLEVNGVDYNPIFKMAEAIKLGIREYEIIDF